MTLGLRTNRPDFDLVTASAYTSETQKNMTALGLSTELDDMLIALGNRVHLIKLASSTPFAYLAVDRADTNLAISARSLTGTPTRSSSGK